jgi:opacity protein-like surface antigen
MMKILLATAASLAMLSAAAAADLPRKEPPPPAPQPYVGKAPIGKYPVGKAPIGKYPQPQPVITKGYRNSVSERVLAQNFASTPRGRRFEGGTAPAASVVLKRSKGRSTQ